VFEAERASREKDIGNTGRKKTKEETGEWEGIERDVGEKELKLEKSESEKGTEWEEELLKVGEQEIK
jgi:hypothetical protein